MQPSPNPPNVRSGHEAFPDEGGGRPAVPEARREAPAASVVVPVYNAERWLPESIPDLLGQTLRDVEFIFVDDGSTDGSVRLLEEAAARDPRVRVLRQERRFAGCARNLGLDAARGKWFIALDADDRFEPTLLEEAVRRGEEADADVVIFDADRLVMPKGVRVPAPSLAWAALLPETPFAPSEETFDAFRTIATWNKLHRKAFLDANGLRYQGTFECNDVRFSFLALACAKRAVALPKTLLHYRVGTEDSVQSRKDGHPFDVVEAYASLKRELEARGLWDAMRRVFLTRAACSFLGGRLCDFSSERTARDWYDRVRERHLSELGLAQAEAGDFLGPGAESLRERLADFLNDPFGDYAWKTLRRTRETSVRQNDRLAVAKTKLADARTALENAKDRLAEQKGKTAAAEKRLAAEKAAREALRRSLSCRVGFAITWPLRAAASLFAKGEPAKRAPRPVPERPADVSGAAPAKPAPGRKTSVFRRSLGGILYSLVEDRLETRLSVLQRKNGKLDLAQKLVSIPEINREKVACEMSLCRGSGVSGADEPGGIVVSLTSHPGRLYDVHFAVHSLLSQTLRPERVVLWLGSDKFPEGRAQVPEALLDLEKRGLEIRFRRDIGPFTKLVPALEAFPDKTIVTADDDVYYAPDLLERLAAAAETAPRSAWAMRARRIPAFRGGTPPPYRTWALDRIGHAPDPANFPTGVGGVLYPPGCLHPDVFDEKAWTETTPRNDDIWFWAMAVLGGSGVGVVPGFSGRLVYVNARREAGLGDDGILMENNLYGARNDSQLAAVLRRYPVLAERLSSIRPDPVP